MVVNVADIPTWTKQAFTNLIDGITKLDNLDISIDKLPHDLGLLVRELELYWVDFSGLDESNTFLENLILSFNANYGTKLVLPSFQINVVDILDTPNKRALINKWCEKYDQDLDLFKIEWNLLIINGHLSQIKIPLNIEKWLSFSDVTDKFVLPSKNTFKDFVSFFWSWKGWCDFCINVLWLEKNSFFWASENRSANTSYGLWVGQDSIKVTTKNKNEEHNAFIFWEKEF